jgi:hypothetical protein
VGFGGHVDHQGGVQVEHPCARQQAGDGEHGDRVAAGIGLPVFGVKMAGLHGQAL